MNSHSEVWWASLNEYPKKRLSTRKETIINLGLIWNKTCIFLSTCYDSPIARGKKERFYKSQVSEHTIIVYSNLSSGIHADVNKRQITGGKNSTDKIEERRRGNIPPNDKLEIWNSGSAIKFQGLKESEPYLPLTNCIFTFCHLEDFLAPVCYLNCFFFVSFFYSIKEYCY